MKHRTFSPNDWNILLSGALAWVVFALLAIILALLGIFWKPLVAALFFATFFVFITFVFLKGWHRTISLELLAIVTISFSVAYLWTQFTEPTLFSGRDQGSISEAVIRLVQNHTIPFSTTESQEFFKIYGPGKALNFPGFFYSSDGTLVTQFPIGYISWLGACYSLLGLFGLIAANSFLFAFSLIFSYAVIRNFIHPFWAWFFFFICGTSFIFVWFSRLTLSENMALPLIWISALALLIFSKDASRGSYITWGSSAILLALTRIEGLMMIPIGFAIILTHRPSRQYIRKNFKKTIIFPSLVAIILFSLNILRDWAFYREMAKVIKSIISPVAIQTGSITNAIGIESIHSWKILWTYGLISYVLIGIAVIALVFIRGRFRILIPFFIALPTFIYLADAHISMDHPWMLRRYFFAALPITMLYTIIGLAKFFNAGALVIQRRLFQAATIFFIISFILGNIMVLELYATFAENRYLLEQTKELSSTFSENDLILIDRLATGDGWSMISGPLSFLYGKHTAYIFNVDDLKKIDHSKFAKTYLIIPKQSEDYYLQKLGNKINPVRNYHFNTQRLDLSNKSGMTLPPPRDILITGTIYEYL